MRSLTCLAALCLLACSGGSTQQPDVAAPPAAPPVSAAPVIAPPPPSDATGAAGATSAPDYAAIVGAADRDAADRELDAGRHPAELLRFCGVREGGQVAEIAAGGGYTAELLARTVGENGKVYAMNSPFILQRFAEGPWSARLQKPVMKNVVRVDREFDDPLPPDAKGLDAVLLILFYHDTVWMKTDRDRMNKAIFAALRPGGVYCVVDHSSRAGAGVSEAETLHRIEEGTVKEEVTRAGFSLVEEAAFLRNPEDKRDWNASPRKAGEMRGTSDRFILRFEKPASAR